MKESTDHQSKEKPDQKCLNALERTSDGIQEKLNNLIDRKISPKQCKSDIVALLEKETKGKLSDETRQLIEKQVSAVNASLVKKTGAEITKDTFFYCLSVMGTGIKYVGGAFVALGAAKWIVSAVSDVTSWCKNNVFKHVDKTGLGKQEAISVTSKVISDTVGVMSTVNAIFGITLSVGAILYTAGKVLEELTPKYDPAVIKMSSEEKERYKQGLIEEIVDVLPKERLRVYREDVTRKKEIEEALVKMDPQRLVRLKGALNKHLEKIRMRKAEKEVQQGVTKVELPSNENGVNNSNLTKVNSATQEKVGWVAKEHRRRSVRSQHDVKRDRT